METMWWILFVVGTLTVGATVFFRLRANASRREIFDEALGAGFVPLLALTMLVRWRPAAVAGFIVVGVIWIRGLWVLWTRYRRTG